MKLSAILWDYDGTIVNSVPKNINITIQILSVVAPRLSGRNLPSFLRSEKAYHEANHRSKNWQDLYTNYYGLTQEEMLKAGTMWTEYQLKNSTPVDLFPEVANTLNQISLPQGVCSQNSSENIRQTLEKNNLLQKITSIVGYDDIPAHAQKPSPEGGIQCLKNILETTLNKIILYVGDHESDVKFARNIEKELGKTNKVISVAATYSGAYIKDWIYKPDFEIDTPLGLLDIINNHHKVI